jgi:hypothetical protein
LRGGSFGDYLVEGFFVFLGHNMAKYIYFHWINLLIYFVNVYRFRVQG